MQQEMGSEGSSSVVGKLKNPSIVSLYFSALIELQHQLLKREWHYSIDRICSEPFLFNVKPFLFLLLYPRLGFLSSVMLGHELWELGWSI